MPRPRSGGGILALIRQAQGLNPNPEEESALKKLTPHVPGIVTFADHNKLLPWSSTYSTVLMFADISGFTALCERYSAMQNKGIDQLTKTLNDYLGAIVDGIVKSEGDVLKFAGDAILAVWRVNTSEELPSAVAKVTRCCLEIQSQCGEWKTDIGVTLTVKMGVASGDMSVTFLGNNEFRLYVELGKAVSDVNGAEHFCQSGYVVLSPDAWKLLLEEPSRWDHEVMEDGNHIRVLMERTQSLSAALAGLPARGFFKRARKNAIAMSFITKTTVLSKEPSDDEQKKQDLASVTESLNKFKTVSENLEQSSTNVQEGVKEEVIKPEPESANVPEKPKKPKTFGSKLGKGGLEKLRSVVKTVTEMRLDEALRLYVLPPVLKKLDDGQPLEYLSEMRQVSIVFMNMVLDDSMDVTKLLQRIFEVVYSNSKTMHGCLNKIFLFDKGCTFLVIFGLPGYKHERDCAHALICSHKMRNILSNIEGVVRVSIGVTTGPTFCGVVGHTNRHEYSVIGRKVNMAARLMMHYPDKVTCDDDTFQWSRLSATHFEVLVTKRMKGLRNVGIIREFSDIADSTSSSVYSVPHFQYPLLGREKEITTFLRELNQINEEPGREEDQRCHIVFVGASGIGKTRLMDNLIVRAEQKNFRVISSAVRINDACNPNKLTRHIMRMLLSTAGYSHRVNKEPVLMKLIKSKKLFNSLYLMNEVLDTEFANPNIGVNPEEENASRQNLLSHLVQKCLEKLGTVMVAIDDAHNIDTESWNFIANLIQFRRVFLVCTIRPLAMESPPCPAASEIFENKNVIVEDIGGIEPVFMCGLACQLMDVVRIPRDLERMLRERSHGVPSWCEQLLIDMADKKQILIVHNDGNLQLLENSIVPKADQISRSNEEAEEENAEESKRKKSFFVATDMLDVSGEDPSGGTKEFLTDLGYVHKKPTRKNIKQERIAVFARNINPDNIPVPLSMKDLIIARLDSMRASDQLVVKCAAVLGTTFTRDMLETILPKVQRVKARKSLKRLNDGGIFECASTPSARHMQTTHGRDSYPREGCFCSRIDIGIGENVCDNMRFKNNLLRDTAYEILMENQRKELHAKAAQYLEKEADEFRNNIPYYILERDPQEDLEERQVKVSVKKSFELSNKVTDFSDTEISAYQKKRRRAIITVKHDIGPLVRKLLEASASEDATEMLLGHLLPLYKDIIFHWKAAKETKRVIELLLESISVALTMKKTAMANDMIDEVQNIFEALSESEKFDEETAIVFKAKITRFKAKAYYLSGDMDKAYKCLRSAASILGLVYVSDSWIGRYRLRNERLKLKNIRNTSDQERQSTQKIIEESYCLNDLYQIDKERDNRMGMYINAIQQLAKVSGRACRLHQLITAYAAMIECSEGGNPSFRKQLETELFASCAERHNELSTNDFYTVAKIYADCSITGMDKGELKRSISTGNGAAEIGERLNDHSLEEGVGPILSMAYILTGRYKDCISYICKFRAHAANVGKMVSLAWFHSISMELILDGGFPIEPFQSSLAFATHYMRSADAVSGEFLSRYFLAMTVATWYSRKQNWLQAQIWFNYWEMYEFPSFSSSSFLFGYARSRKIEAMLLSYRIRQSRKTKRKIKALENAIEQEFRMLEMLRKTIPSIKPRCFHLKAYYCMLKGQKTSAYRHLSTSIRCSKMQQNDLELEWARHHLRLWFCGVQKDDVWNKFTDQHILDWRLTAGLKRAMPLYTLPLI